MNMPRRFFASLLVAHTLGANSTLASARLDTNEQAANVCKGLEAEDFSTIADAPTELTAATYIASSGREPAYCLAKGYVAPQVGIELRLPTANWNGKFLEVGCGGSCGVFFSQLCTGPLRRGYACIATDMGHTAATNQALWAYGNLQAQIDWAYRAAHVAAIAGKAITKAYYNRTVSRSYFFGCSTGGREALVESQRFPWDFDGIIAGAPVVNTAGLVMDLLWDAHALQAPDGRPIMSAADAAMLHKAVVDKCDMDDGVRDGIITNPRACRFDLAALQCRGISESNCLTPAQVAAARSLYSGPPAAIVDRSYTEGATPGSELNWVSDFLSVWSSRRLFSEWLQYQGFMPAPGVAWKLDNFDFNRDYKRLGMWTTLPDAHNPDLRKFAALGGKLLVYFGWNDVSPPEATDYYQSVERTMGGRAATQNFFRLFMVPGMDHCTGGEGAFAIDYLSYMEDWVERRHPPDKIIGAHIDGLTWADAFGLPFPLDAKAPVAFTRPVFPYPARAMYTGSGNANDATNFKPVQ